MDFSRVTAMSYGGRSVSSVWYNGQKVWPTEESSVLVYVDSAPWSAPVSWPNVYARVSWEINYGNLTISTEVPDVIVQSGSGGFVSGNWGENHSGGYWTVPSNLYGQTITLDYTLNISYGSNYDDLMNGGPGLDETITGGFSWTVPVPADGQQLYAAITPPEIAANGRVG